MNTKIIFLDFDGVITTPKSKWQLILTTLLRNKCSGLNDGKLIDKILKK